MHAFSFWLSWQWKILGTVPVALAAEGGVQPEVTNLEVDMCHVQGLLYIPALIAAFVCALKSSGSTGGNCELACIGTTAVCKLAFSCISAHSHMHELVIT